MTDEQVRAAECGLPGSHQSERASLRIAATGYVSEAAGSVAGANSLVLRALLNRGHQVAFHSKPGFVDPRPIVAGCEGQGGFSFVDCTNALPDRLHQRAIKLGRLAAPLRTTLGWWDDRSYRRGIARSLARMVRAQPDPTRLVHWMGTWAYRRVDGVLNVSSPQGAPGTDARSLERHRETIIRLTSRSFYLKLRGYAAWRLGAGLPRFGESDLVVVGSSWSRQALIDLFDVPAARVKSLPYPIDLRRFQPPDGSREATGPLRLLWVGRFAPRKRLDLLLDGVAEAIRGGLDVVLTVVGRSAFVPNYETLLREFPYRDRLNHIDRLPRDRMPAIMAEHDALAQPSDEEDFGSSIAEAQACGMPAIVGATNGTGDYVCGRSIRLRDDRVETFAEAVAQLADAKRAGALADPTPSRLAAERHYAIESVVQRLEAIFATALEEAR